MKILSTNECRLPRWPQRVLSICLLAAFVGAIVPGQAAAPAAIDLDQLLRNSRPAQPFPTFNDSVTSRAAFLQIKTALDRGPAEVLNAININESQLNAAELALRTDGKFEQAHQMIFDEMRYWLVMARDADAYFADVADILLKIHGDQVLTVSTTYQFLTIEPGPSDKAKQSLGDIYLTMFTNTLGIAGDLLGFAGSTAISTAVKVTRGIVATCLAAAAGATSTDGKMITTDSTPLLLQKTKLEVQLKESYNAAVLKGNMIRDLVLGDYQLLKDFSQINKITGADRNNLTESYRKAFAREMWLTLLAPHGDYETVWMPTKAIDDYVCRTPFSAESSQKDALNWCVKQTGRSFASQRMAVNPDLAGIAFAAVYLDEGRIESDKLSAIIGSKFVVFAFDIRAGRRKASNEPTALPSGVLPRMIRDGVSRSAVSRIIGGEPLAVSDTFQPVQDLIRRKQIFGDSGQSLVVRRDSRVADIGFIYDSLHGGFLEHAQPDEINLDYVSPFPPALEVFAPQGEVGERLALAYTGPDQHGATNTVYLTTSADGRAWKPVADTYDHYVRDAKHVPFTGPSLLNIGGRLLVAFGSGGLNRIYGYYLDGSTFESTRPAAEAEFCKSTKVSNYTDDQIAYLGHNCDTTFNVLCTPLLNKNPDLKSFKIKTNERFDPVLKGIYARTCNTDFRDSFLSRWNFKALRTWDMEKYQTFVQDARLPENARLEGKSRELRTEFRDFGMYPLSESPTKVQVAMTRTNLAHLGPNKTDNAAMMLFTNPNGEVHVRQGDFDGFEAFKCSPDPKAADKTPVCPKSLAATTEPPAVVAYPDWAAVAYLASAADADPATIKFAKFEDALAGKFENVNLPTVIKPRTPSDVLAGKPATVASVVPASGPNMVYDAQRGLLFLAFADTSRTLHLLMNNIAFPAWIPIRQIENETSQRPALTIFKDRVWVGVRRENGQIAVAPIYDMSEPKYAFLMADDPVFSNDSGLFPPGAWTIQADRNDPSVGIAGWSNGVPNFGPKLPKDYSAAWYTTFAEAYPELNKANAILRTPAITLPAVKPGEQPAQATLSFTHWMTSSASGGGKVRYAVKLGSGLSPWTDLPLTWDAGDKGVPVLASGQVALDTKNRWQDVTALLPAHLYGAPFQLEFQFQHPQDGLTRAGWIIDRVKVSLP